MTEPTAPQPAGHPAERSTRHGRAFSPLAVAAAAVVGLALVGLAAFLAIRGPSRTRGTAGMPLQITRISSTLSPLPLPSPPVAEIDDTQVSLPVPVALEIGDRTFPVQIALASGEAWSNPSAYPGSAIWVYGTVVNYVMGLEASPDTEAVVGPLRVGDPLILRLSSGVRLQFRVAERETVRPDDAAIFGQSRPGLTLVLLGGQEARRETVFADFDRLEEPAPSTAGPTAGVGQPVQVGDVQVTLLEGGAQERGVDLQPGTMVYLVEFRVRNTSAMALDPRAFVTELEDASGARYLPWPSASSQGRYGPLQERLEPGEEVNGSVGYLVPDTLAGPTLVWIFGPRADSELRARFSIPYSPARAEVWPEVTVLQAFLGEEGEVLHIVARVRNTGSGLLEVTAADVSLSSSAGPGELETAAPPFPWSIAGGEAREVELQFARPMASTCIVTILGYTFEISGLP